MKPSLSIIVPAYNMENWLPVALESCLDQSNPNVEVIVVNDGSPDSSGEIADRYAASDQRVKVIHQENAGAGASREAGQAAATCKYLHFLDADDLLDPHAVRDMVGTAERDNVELVCGNAVVFSDVTYNTRTYFPHPVASRLNFAKSPRYWKSKVAWRWIISTDFVRRNELSHPPFKMGQDVLFMYEALTRCDAFSQCPLQFYFFRQDHKKVNMTIDTLLNHQIAHYAEAKRILMQAHMPGPLVKYLNENFFRDIKNAMPSLHNKEPHLRETLLNHSFSIFDGLDPALFDERIPEGAKVDSRAIPLFKALCVGDRKSVEGELDSWGDGRGKKKDVNKNSGFHALRRRIKSALRPMSLKTRHRLNTLAKRAAKRLGR
ncbi:MAG: family 2 glycosyl transferase [Desulfovibrio sp.]|nr:family 2 glycosyl transferase [Desulfovibrio sp.]